MWDKLLQNFNVLISNNINFYHCYVLEGIFFKIQKLIKCLFVFHTTTEHDLNKKHYENKQNKCQIK